MHFGISTILYGDRPLAREHLAAFAAQGFGTVELFAVRGHFDYQDAAVVGALAGWLAETGLTLHSVHAPVVDRIDGERWGAPLSIASADAGRRARAVREVEAALAIAARVPFRHLVVHVGTPDLYATATADDTPEAARRSLEALAPRASGLGVRLALEVLRNRLSSVEALVGLIDDLAIPGAGLCLDFGHVHIPFLTDLHEGDLPSEYSFVKMNVQNLILTTFKKAEDENAYIFQWYESEGQDTEAEIEFPIQPKNVFLSNFLEEDLEELEFDGNKLVMETKGNSMMTIKVYFK